MFRGSWNSTPFVGDETGLELCGITWQEGGTGDTYVSAALLFGVSVGNGGGAAGAMTDYAGTLIKVL